MTGQRNTRSKAAIPADIRQAAQDLTEARRALRASRNGVLREGHALLTSPKALLGAGAVGFILGEWRQHRRARVVRADGVADEAPSATTLARLIHWFHMGNTLLRLLPI